MKKLIQMLKAIIGNRHTVDDVNNRLKKDLLLVGSALNQKVALVQKLQAEKNEIAISISSAMADVERLRDVQAQMQKLTDTEGAQNV